VSLPIRGDFRPSLLRRGGVLAKNTMSVAQIDPRVNCGSGAKRGLGGVSVRVRERSWIGSRNYSWSSLASPEYR